MVVCEMVVSVEFRRYLPRPEQFLDVLKKKKQSGGAHPA